ncbi:30S ribosome-binding factor RbfA [Candidatus Manganitrophus noduliformans]|uniref:Ribosome-binding factor A n=1 Tax=Candidatus Manganitrophus noduliformans TaxID=2606439 RepID=A0A7X6DPE8_9BACT|nr:30S ribosome-binding factor RbfA [Candidatus Manganitrophus noduliformans]NKE70905.1 30S ribosome-binding factor RbfA [Candidatus Manganitrophus noduliformans]
MSFAVQEYKRTNRIGDQIKMEVADILTTKIRDPRIGFVTVTSVEVSDDLKHAKIFVTVQKDQDAKQAFMGLRKATGFVRAELSRRLQIRRVPEVAFLPDESTEKISHILDLLDRIEKEKR